MPTATELAADELATSHRGAVLRPGEPAYEEARALYNGMIDRRPALIARCVDAADVIAAVDVSRRHGLEIAVRGGGHNGGGLGSVDDGLVIDLSAMRGVRVDPGARTAQVAGGAKLGDLDHATHAFGLCTPAGIHSTTGVAGLTLGGGHGYLSRKHGLTIDNLLEADVVLADGRLVTASSSENADLFWALRGGGGNFGVVTSFTFRLHPIGAVTAAITLWPAELGPDVMRWYRDFSPRATEDLSGFFAFLTVPPGPPFPAEIHLMNACGVVWCYAGEPQGFDEAFAPVRQMDGLAFEWSAQMPYPAIQGMFDQLLPTGLQWYWRGDFFNRISDESIDVHMKYGTSLPTPLSTMHLYPIDGAPQRVGKDETAWAYRDAVWSGVIAGIDPEPGKARAIRDWCVAYWDDLHPHSMGGAYVNFMMDEGDERVRATYRDHYRRLTEIKAKYDPENLFHINQNIRAPQTTG